ncbi:hypothetical protein Q5P01_022796 [Channa striata]|uniref:Apolipoprotein L, 1 n=1 Tax=Channa striata TaxID=64152 RepID=A0AA88LRP6_CHASR|nr:hypothetical protein Q5P01_022796 [Channa striata]
MTSNSSVRPTHVPLWTQGNKWSRLCPHRTDRYQNLDLELECDGGAAAQKTVLLRGVLKRSSKSVEPSVQRPDSLSADSELSKSNESLTDNSNTKDKGGFFKGMFKKSAKVPKDDQQQATVLIKNPTLSASSDSLTDNNPAKHKSDGRQKQSPKPGHAERPSQDVLNNQLSVSEDSLSEHTHTKESVGVFSGMFKRFSKPFGVTTQSQDDLSAPTELSRHTKNETEEDTVTHKKKEKQVDEKPELVKSNVIQRERERSETPLVPPRPTEEEMKRRSTCDTAKPRVKEEKQDEKDVMSRQKEEPPVVPPRPSKEELDRAVKRDGLLGPNSNIQSQTKEKECPEGKESDEMNSLHNKMAVSEDEGTKEDKCSPKEEKTEEEGKEKTEETRVRKPKRHNPFMPRVKAKVIQKEAQGGSAGNAAEPEVGNRSLFEQLDDFCIYPAKPESRDVENLMEWWNTVESWEDTPQDDVMTEKEEAKAFAVTADKVQKGIRVFNKLFSERAESLWQHVIDLNSIADGLDKFNKNTKIAQITGGSTSAIGGIATIAGLALAPVTMGTSLIVTAVGLGVATAGGLTSAGAGISNQVNNSMDRKKVEKLVEDYQEKIADLNKCLKFIQQGIENLRRFDLIKMKKRAYNRDFPVLSSSLYEDGAMAGKAIVSNANEIMRVVQIAHMAGSTAARAVQIASMATGVLTGLFVGMDIYFVAKDSKELKKGAKSEFAAKIREVATQLHDGLVELNGIRVELQTTTQSGGKADKDKAAVDGDKTQKDDKYEEEEEEIDQIKKAVRKDSGN